MTDAVTPTQADRKAAADWENISPDYSIVAYRLAQAFARHAAEAREEGAKLAIAKVVRMLEKRLEDRFSEHGTREWDTNATYYSGAQGEMFEALDEEGEEILQNLRGLDPAEVVKGGNP